MPTFAAQWALFSHDSKRIYTGGADPHIWVWDAATLDLQHRIPTSLPSVNGASFHPALDQIAFGGVDGEIQCWDLIRREQLFSAKLHTDRVTRVEWVDQDTLVSAGRDGTVRLSDACTGKRIGRLQRLGGPVHGLATSSQQHIGVVHFRGVRVWDKDFNTLIDYAGLYYHGGELQSDLEFSPDGTYVWVTFRTQPHLRIWRLSATDNTPFEPIDLPGPAFEVAASPDGKVLAIALYREIVLIRTADNARLSIWPAPHGDERTQSPVHGLCFSPDARMLTSLDVLGGVWIWPVPES